MYAHGLPPDPSVPYAIPGRSNDWALLARHLDNLRERDEGATVLISGEAGIGKTTLVDALTAEARRSDVVVLSATAYDQEIPTPYGLWQEVVRSARRYPDLPSPPLETFDPHAMESAGSARKLWSLTTDVLLGIADDRRLLVVLEDLHWADQPSIELLRYFARQAAGARVLIIATYRDIDLTPALPLYHLLPHLLREVRPPRIPLGPIPRQATHAIVRSRYASLPASEADRLVAYLDQYAEGNPLFIEELLGYLEDRRVLRLAGATWTLGTLPAFAVPPLIRQIIEGRLDSLSPSGRQALELAAVIGNEVSLDLWQGIYALHNDNGLEAFEEVLATRVLQETPQVDIVRFRHALVRDTIYGSTNVLRRPQWHRQIGDLLAARPAVDPETVAHHYLQADDDRAAEWLIESARRANRRFAFQSAIASYERALAILEHDPAQTATLVGVLCALGEANRFSNTTRALAYIRRAIELADHSDDRGAQVLARWVHARIRGFDDGNVVDDLLEAVAAFEQLSSEEQERIVSTSLGYVVSDATLAQDLANYGLFNAARQRAERFLATHSIAASSNRDIEFGNAHFGLGIARAALGEPEPARAAFETSRAYFGESGNFQMVANACYWELSSVSQIYGADAPGERHRLQQEEARANLQSEFVSVKTGERIETTSETLILDGDWDACMRSANLRIGIPVSRVPSARKLAEIEWLRGNHEQAWAFIQMAMPAGPEEPPGRRFFLHRQDIQWIAAELALDEGDVEQSRRWIDAFEAWLNWSGRTAARATVELLRARWHGCQDDLDNAFQHARNGLNLASEQHQPVAMLRAHRLLGEFSAKSGEFDEAIQHFELALTIAESCAAPYEIAVTRVAWAEALHASGRSEEARELLVDARQTAERLTIQPLLDRIDAIMAQPEEIPVAKEAPTLGLTPRQIEVLRLLAQGMTDAEIASELFISPRTVHGHLNAIYSKLDVQSRTAAVARAFAEGIVAG